ncbi:MAG: FAD-dependent oxidoreductase [Bacteroidota bacterium]
MDTSQQTAVVIGASHAGAQLVASLRTEGWEGRIIMISDEAFLPYHHPPLSKDFLSGEKEEDKLWIRSESFYEKQQIEFTPNQWVKSIDRAAKNLHLVQGETIAYDKLALCTGAAIRKLNVPGAELENVLYLRDLADAKRLKTAIAGKQRAVIIGGGYIGLEAAASLSKFGIRSTVLEAGERVLQRVACQEVSDYITAEHQRQGVSIHCNTLVSSIHGEDKVESVHCQGGESYPADLVVIGIGVNPNIELAEASGLTCSDGIHVDEFARTDDHDIVAAGDCTFHPNQLYELQLRLESVPNAVDQARTAAASLCGKEKAYNSLPWFWSDQFGLKLQTAGINAGYDQVLVRDEGESGFVAWYLNQGKLLAADCINQPRVFAAAKMILTQQYPVTQDELIDSNFDLREVVKRNR